VDDAIPGQVEPLISLRFPKLVMFVSSWSSSLQAVLDFAMEADHFDPRLQLWEPMLRGMDTTTNCEDAWKCQMTVRQEENGRRNVNMVARRVLTFCVTRAMIASFRRLSTIWTATDQDLRKLARRFGGFFFFFCPQLFLFRQFGFVNREISHLPSSSSLRAMLLEPDQKSQEQVARPYVVSNLTGHPIRWSFGSDPPRTLGGEKGKNAAFWSPEQGSRWVRQQRPVLSLYLDDDTVLRNLPTDGARVLCFATHAQKRTVVYEVKYELGSRVLEVRSNIVVLSDLQVPLKLYSEGKLLGDLEPQGMFALPLASSNKRLSIGPGARLEEETFDQETLRDGAVEQLNGVLKYSHRIRGGQGTVLSLTATATPDLLLENTFWWSVVIRAPIKIRNLLVTDVFVQLKDSRGKLVVEETKIESGRTREFLLVADTLSVRYNDYEWSPFLALKSCNEFSFHSGGEIRVENISEAGTVRYKDSETVAYQTLTLWIPFWVVNNTSHKIFAQEIPLVPFLEAKKMIMFGGSELHLGLFGEKKSKVFFLLDFVSCFFSKKKKKQKTKIRPR
jgi:hypothetical protein